MPKTCITVELTPDELLEIVRRAVREELNGDGRRPHGQQGSLLTTSEAAVYCGFRNPSSLRKAKLEGRVSPAGRRGGRGQWMWSVRDLDRFLVGNVGSSQSDERPRPVVEPAAAAPEQGRRPIPKPAGRRQQLNVKPESATERALRRLREMR